MKKEHNIYVEIIVQGEKPQYKCFLLFSDNNKGTREKIFTDNMSLIKRTK